MNSGEWRTQKGKRLKLAVVFLLSILLMPLVAMLFAIFQGGQEAVVERWSFLEARVFDRLVNSLALGASATLIALVIGLPFAFALHRTRFPGRRFVAVAALVPLLIPPHIHAISWLRIVGNTGYVTHWFADRGIDFDVRQGFLVIGGEATFYPGTIWMLTASFWPLIPLLMAAGFRQMDTRQEEAACLQRGLLRSRLSVALPALRPFVLSGAFFVFLFSVGCYAIPSLLDTPTIMQEIWFPSNNVDVQTAAVVALPLVLVCIVGLILILRLMKNHIRPARTTASQPSDQICPRSKSAGIFCWLVVLTTAGWPFFSLIEEAGSPEIYRAVWKNVQQPETRNITNSLMLAAGTALLIAGVSVVIALAGRTSRRWRLTTEAASLLPFAFPAIVVGVSVNLFWSRFESVSFIDTWIYNGAWIGIFTWTALFLPFGVRAVSASLDRIPPSHLEAAELSSRSRFRVLRWVLLPMIRPGVFAALLLGFILSLGELPAAMIVNPGRFQTAQVRVFNMIHFSRDEEVAALCVMIVVVGLIPLLLFSLLSRKKLEIL